MEDWTRVLLYGTYDGFSRSTLGDVNIQLNLDNGERVEVPNHFVKNANDFVEKNKIKLKDIIARMEGLNGSTRLEWLDDILYKFGSSYGASKYRAGYKQGKLEGEWVGQQLKDADKIRQELNKPVVPQFVADWIETCKENNIISLSGAFEYAKEEVGAWLNDWSNQETFARAWLFGYTVEKEKRYYIRLKGVDENYNYFNCIKHLDAWCLTEIKTDKKFRMTHTRKQLEEAGFGWVFDCEGIELEEVK
ncbi:DUF1642 domain-containing protein [uncultured Streptococcus sp.]|uniref:DUF1642 domain-containing protein n=1 Tax=uncultured Streptococcus sp. TaxID=83427 RepID=UPI0028E36BA3|nr:DUF1642 domain-containing protein [uncultured Streptococcus sp.]